MEYRILKKDPSREDLSRVADLYIALDFDVSEKTLIEVIKGKIATIKDKDKMTKIEKLLAD